MKTATVRINGAEDAEIIGGDSVDLGPDGIVVWLVDEDAAAWRLTHEKRARELRRALAYARRGAQRR